MMSVVHYYAFGGGLSFSLSLLSNMEHLILRAESWNSEYSCSSYDFGRYQDAKYDNFYLSLSYVVLGFAFLFLYLPCVFAMTRNNMLSESCYKIMFILSLYDILGLITCGIVTGFFGVFRYGFCFSPMAHYIVGCFGTFSWFGQVMTAILLALNRCICLQSVYVGNILFDGHRTWIWILIGLLGWSLVGLVVSRPGILNLGTMVWFFNPHAGFIDDDAMVYVSSFHYANNVIAATALPGVYILFLILYYLKTKNWVFKNSNHAQQSVFFQSVLISLFTAILATLYIIVQYVPIPNEYYCIAQLMWIVFSGLASLIYLTMNHSIRKSIVKPIFSKETTVVPYSAPNPAHPFTKFISYLDPH